jgi:hypothetical protein
MNRLRWWEIHEHLILMCEPHADAWLCECQLADYIEQVTQFGVARFQKLQAGRCIEK